jgi:predicted PurR-regulated permease PerM
MTDDSTAAPTAIPAPDPATDALRLRSETASYVLAGASLLFLLHFHLVPALFAGLLVHVLLTRPARWLHGARFSHHVAKWLAAGILALLAGAAVTGGVLLLHAFWRGHVGNLPDIYQKMADALETTRAALVKQNLGSLLPGMDDASPLSEHMTRWLREHQAALKHAGAEGGRLLLHLLLGVVIGLLVFFEPAAPEGRTSAKPVARPLAKALAARVDRFAEAFQSILFAQVEISAINTVLTTLFLFAVQPLFGVHLPFRGTLVVVTFVAGLIPIAGNLVSNSIIVIVSLGVSPWAAAGALAFLVAVHKAEYFLNAKIVGSRIGVSAWEILLAIVAFEVAFGAVGVVLAPIVYAWLKRELADRGLV